jgi:hypothetical protein
LEIENNLKRVAFAPSFIICDHSFLLGRATWSYKVDAYASNAFVVGAAATTTSAEPPSRRGVAFDVVFAAFVLFIVVVDVIVVVSVANFT